MKKSNPIYSKIFARISAVNTDSIIHSLSLLRADLHSLNKEQSLVYSCMWEELEERLGDDFDATIEMMDIAA